MRILVDENIPRLTVTYLQAKGWDVSDVRGTDAQASVDTQLWHRAVTEKRLLITTDKGFVEYRNQDHFGILIVRLRQPNRQKIHDRVVFGMERCGGGLAGDGCGAAGQHHERVPQKYLSGTQAGRPVLLTSRSKLPGPCPGSSG